MGRLYIPQRSPAWSRPTLGDIAELVCIGLFVGNLAFWAGLFAGKF